MLNRNFTAQECKDTNNELKENEETTFKSDIKRGPEFNSPSATFFFQFLSFNP
jgi:hypothetical protein